ncbi:MAG: DUF4157 domain-containing protein [Bacteroidia bacterium]|nr:DUF4157 domain-containing protein [Bacteroidia bacterium]
MSKTLLTQLKEEKNMRREDTTRTMTPPGFSPEAAAIQAKFSGKREENQVANSGSSSAKLPESVQAKMESSMGTDFSDVNVHANSNQAESIGALAYTQGNDVHFAPGQFNPETSSGQKLIGHELAHVKQQKEGRVAANNEVGGMPLNDAAGLENEADQMGAKAAAGEKSSFSPVQQKSGGSNVSQKKNAPVQRFKVRDSDQKDYPKFTSFVANELSKADNDPRLVKYLNIFGTNQGDTARNIHSDVQWGQGPELRPYKMSKSSDSFRDGVNSEIIRIARGDMDRYEKARDSQTDHYKLLLESSIMNGYTRLLDDQDGQDLWGNEGAMTEKKVFGADIDSTWDARMQENPRFGSGEYEVTVVGKSAGFGQRVKIWNAESGNGYYPGTPGTSFGVTGKASKGNQWRIRIDHNTQGADAKAGWEHSKMLCTQESKNKWLIRSEDWTDRDRNDLQVLITKKK